MGTRYGYKVVGVDRDRIAKLRITGEVVAPKGHKRRTSKVVTVWIKSRVGMKNVYGHFLNPKLGKRSFKKARSSNFGGSSSSCNTHYEVGKETFADRLDFDRSNECGAGINFFNTLELALNYNP